MLSLVVTLDRRGGCVTQPAISHQSITQSVHTASHLTSIYLTVSAHSQPSHINLPHSQCTQPAISHQSTTQSVHTASHLTSIHHTVSAHSQPSHINQSHSQCTQPATSNQSTTQSVPGLLSYQQRPGSINPNTFPLFI